MEDRISYAEAYNQAMMELNPIFAELAWQQKFNEIEIEEELELLKVLNNSDCCVRKSKTKYNKLEIT